VQPTHQNMKGKSHESVINISFMWEEYHAEDIVTKFGTWLDVND